MRLSKRAKLAIGLGLGGLILALFGGLIDNYLLTGLGRNASIMSLGVALTTPDYFDE